MKRKPRATIPFVVILALIVVAAGVIYFSSSSIGLVAGGTVRQAPSDLQESTQNLTAPSYGRAAVFEQTNKVDIIDTRTNQKINSFFVPLEIFHAAVTNNGKYAYVTGRVFVPGPLVHGLYRIDLSTGTNSQIANLSSLVPNLGTVWDIELSPNNATVAVSVSDTQGAKVLLFNTATGTLSHLMTLCNNPNCVGIVVQPHLNFMTFSADGKYLVVPSYSGPDSKIFVIDTQLATPAVINTLSLAGFTEFLYGLKLGSFPDLYALRAYCTGPSPCPVIRKFDLMQNAFDDIGDIGPAEVDFSLLEYTRPPGSASELVVGSYLSNLDSFSLSTFLSDSGEFTGEIAASGMPLPIVYIKEKNELWVLCLPPIAVQTLCSPGGLVDVFNLSTRTLTHSIPIETGPFNVGMISALSTDGKYIYLPSYETSKILVFDTTTYTELPSISTSQRPNAIYAYSIAPPVQLPEVTVVAVDNDAMEGNHPNANTGRYTLTRTGSTVAAMQVNLSVSGTAANGIDYSVLLQPPLPGTFMATIPSTVIFPAGVASVDFVLLATDDALVEGSETAKVSLASGSGYFIGTFASAQVTINDDD